MRGLAVLAVAAATLVAAAGPPSSVAQTAPRFSDCNLPTSLKTPTDDWRKKWWGDEGRPMDWNRFREPVGTKKAVMLFVDFPNHTAESNAAPYNTTQGYTDFFAPASTFFRNASYGRMDLQITPVNKFYRLPNNDTTYNIARDMPLTVQGNYIKEVVKLADADVDFSAYDLVYIVPVRNSRVALSPAFVDSSRTYVPADGGYVSHGVTFGMDMWSWGYKILVHETTHTFGIPDLYLEPGDTHGAVRGWDLMGNIGGRAPDYFAWNKLKLGWIDDAQVDCVTAPGTTEHTLTPLETAGGTKAVVVRTGESTAYAIESRRALGEDAQTCATGPLIYSINAPLVSGMGPLRIVDPSPGSPTTSTCADLDRATLQPSGPTTLQTPDGVRIELVAQTATTDTIRVTQPASQTQPVGGTVPATLALTLGSPSVSFGAFTPGVAKDYIASTTANVVSTAGDARLDVSDPGHLANGSFLLPQPLQVTFSQSTWAGPATNAPVTIGFSQHVDATDPLRTGNYTKGLTFSLSTTTP
jgi:M6 family metalloprotease-like protein